MLDAISRAKRQTSLVTSGVTRGFPNNHRQMHNEDNSPTSLHDNLKLYYRKQSLLGHTAPPFLFGSCNCSRKSQLKILILTTKGKTASSVDVTITITTHPRGKLDKWHVVWQALLYTNCLQGSVNTSQELGKAIPNGLMKVTHTRTHLILRSWLWPPDLISAESSLNLSNIAAQIIKLSAIPQKQ